MDLLPQEELQVSGGSVLLNGENVLTATKQRTRALFARGERMTGAH